MHPEDCYYSFIIRLFAVITHRCLILFPSGPILHPVPLSLYIFNILSFLFFNSSVCWSMAIRYFMFCFVFLKLASIVSFHFCPVSSFLPSSAHEEWLECSSFRLIHSSLAWFTSRRCMMHARVNAQTYTDTPQTALSASFPAIFHSVTQWEQIVYSQKCLHLIINVHLHRKSHVLRVFFPLTHIELRSGILLCLNTELVSPPLSCDWTVNVAGEMVEDSGLEPQISTLHFIHPFIVQSGRAPTHGKACRHRRPHQEICWK